MKKVCGNCALLNNENICLLDRSLKRGPFDTVCENYHSNVSHCDVCSGLLITGGILTETSEGWRLICETCYSKVNTCDMCQEICGVNNDNSGIPKVIPQQMRQDNMILQANIINPELIKKYCPNCSCFSDNVCKRNENYCNKYNGII